MVTYQQGRGIHRRGKDLELGYRRGRFRSPEAHRGVIPCFVREGHPRTDPGDKRRFRFKIIPKMYDGFEAIVTAVVRMAIRKKSSNTAR